MQMATRAYWDNKEKAYFVQQQKEEDKSEQEAKAA